jgi:hypothetical protein
MSENKPAVSTLSGAELLRQTMSILRQKHLPYDGGHTAKSWRSIHSNLDNFGNCVVDLGSEGGRWLLIGFARKGCGQDKDKDKKVWLSLAPYKKMYGKKVPCPDIGWRSDGYGYLPFDCSFLSVEVGTGLLGVAEVSTTDVIEMLIDLLPNLVEKTFRAEPGYDWQMVGKLFRMQAATYKPNAPDQLAAVIENIVASIAEAHLKRNRG